MGLAGRAFGLTLDRVTSFDVVTADARRRRVDGDDPLFWALRGGGGSFAIVTAIRLTTRRVTTASLLPHRLPPRRPRRGAARLGRRSRPAPLVD